jgi:hypothetical protein
MLCCRRRGTISHATRLARPRRCLPAADELQLGHLSAVARRRLWVWGFVAGCGSVCWTLPNPIASSDQLWLGSLRRRCVHLAAASSQPGEPTDNKNVEDTPHRRPKQLDPDPKPWPEARLRNCPVRRPAQDGQWPTADSQLRLPNSRPQLACSLCRTLANRNASPSTEATRAEMSEAKLPIPYRDGCANLLIPLNKCRRDSYYLPWKCEVRVPP